MVDTIELEVMIKRANLTKKAISKELGISTMSLYKKINNQSEFRTKELAKLVDLLGIENLKELSGIFFTCKHD